jgi:hypothetical protein
LYVLSLEAGKIVEQITESNIGKSMSSKSKRGRKKEW